MTYAMALAIFHFAKGARPSLREIVARYRELAKQYHPDAGGSHDEMVQVINAKYVLAEGAPPRGAQSGQYEMDEYYRTGQPDENYRDWKRRLRRYVKNMESLQYRRGNPGCGM